MKKQPKLLYYAYPLALLLLLSCQRETLENGDLRLLELEAIELNPTAYAIEKVIPLETTSANLLGDYLTVKFSEKACFVFDESARDAIHRYDLNGKYLGRFIEIGDGPNRIESVNDFIPTPEGLEILSVKGDRSTIIQLDRNGEMTGQLTLDYYGTSFAKLPGGYYAASGSYNLPFVENRLAIIDEQGKTVKTFLPNTHALLPMQEKNFYAANGSVFFHEIYNNRTYQILEDSLAPSYQFDFGTYRIPERFFEMDWMAGFEMLSQQGFAVISQHWESEKKAFFGVDVQADGERKNHQIILDKRDLQAKKRIASTRDLAAFYHPVGVFDEFLVFIAQAPDYLKLEADQLPDDSPMVQEGDNPVLLFVDF
ncbi:6-bladed beta-propeller [Cyclobacterium xiamenense]|uniref:6-bladed beta-propeller n=1 Tax=Cyclobacterium xiamenense TaxID=1297121 RepID=UPI0035CEED2E